MIFRWQRSRFYQLLLAMMAFGALVGLIFPPLSIWMLSLPWSALSMEFFGLALGAGIVVGWVNYMLFQRFVAITFSQLARGMRHVEERLARGDVCDVESCLITIESEDAMGDAARAFNALLGALAFSRRQTEFLNHFLLALTRNLERKDVWKAICKDVMEQAACQGAALLLEHKGCLQVIHACGLEGFPKEGFSLEQGLLAEAAKGPRPITLLIPQDLPLTFNALAAGMRPYRISLFPLACREGKGVLMLAWVISDPPPLAEGTLEAASRSLAVAIDNLMSFKRLQEMAALDPLTELYNRRFGERRLSEEMARARRERRSLAVAMVDLDHFKVINDTYGHLAGDAVLRQVTQRLTACLRASDVVIRYGGEEFLILFPDADKVKAKTALERCLALCRETPCMWEENPIKVTLSAGVALLDEEGERDTPEGLVARADRRLYQAKAAGRDRVAVENGLVP